jgi:peptide/nickel transport system substrate-binding protein
MRGTKVEAIRGISPLAGAAIAIVAALAQPVAVAADETPRRGGTLTFAVNAEPPSYDCQTTTTYVAVQTLNPHYSQLVKFDPENYPNLKGDVAEAWSVAPDGLSITFKLRPGVRFHDGSPLTSADVKATFDRIRRPPEGIVSVRQVQFEDVSEIEAPDERTVIFRLANRSASILTSIASPWNCLYSAAKLKSDPRWPERNIMGSGPYRFVEHVKGSHWVGRRFEDYFEPGRPYLDGFRIEFITGAPMVNALIGQRIQAEFRGLPPSDRDKVKAALGDKVVVAEAPWTCKLDIFFNVTKPPFDDLRVRRALSLAIDRWGGAQNLARIAFVREVGGVLRPGGPHAATTQQLEALTGFGRNPAAAREEARRLLKEAGQSDLKFKLVTRNVPMPFSAVAVFVIDQWRQIGVQVENQPLNVAQQKATYLGGNHEVGLDANCYDLDEPDAMLSLYVSGDKSPINSSRATDRTLDDLFEKQKRENDVVERDRLIRAFETRAMEQAYAVPVVWWHRIVVHSAALKGWRIMPSHYLNQDLAGVWLAQ